MERRTQEAYVAVLTHLRGLLPPPLRIRRVITDYERGQQNAWSAIFACTLQGCLWHLARVSVTIMMCTTYNSYFHILLSSKTMLFAGICIRSSRFGIGVVLTQQY